MITVTGNTFHAKHIIKSIPGFKWNPKFKSWDKQGNLSQEQLDKLSAIDGIEVSDYNEREGNTRDLIDNRSHKQRFGRCEDAPCCGCCGQYAY